MVAKTFEELRQAYKELLADNQQLIADNRKLRQEVTELKQLNDGYVKIIAKNQETNNKLMASVQKQTDGDLISRADALMELNGVCSNWQDDAKVADIINALPSADAEPIERISDNTIVVKYADYEDIGRIILTNGDIFCKMFYEDARQNDDSDYINDIPDEYMTEPSDLMSHEETDGVIKINKQSAKEVGEIKHIVIRSPNYTRYFYNESMPLPSADAISREEYEDIIKDYRKQYEDMNNEIADLEAKLADAEPKWNCTANFVAEQLDRLRNMTDEERWDFFIRFFSPSADAEWIPCSERLPSDDEIVNITWVNHNPPPYYADIAEKPFVASGLRYRGKWYWYSSVCQDLHQNFDLIDKDIEVVAWIPLPKPYKGGDSE